MIFEAAPRGGERVAQCVGPCRGDRRPTAVLSAADCFRTACNALSSKSNAFRPELASKEPRLEHCFEKPAHSKNSTVHLCMYSISARLTPQMSRAPRRHDFAELGASAPFGCYATALLADLIFNGSTRRSLAQAFDESALIPLFPHFYDPPVSNTKHVQHRPFEPPLGGTNFLGATPELRDGTLMGPSPSRVRDDVITSRNHIGCHDGDVWESASKCPGASFVLGWS